jgi:uncharacterized membrane protein YidH (DUF202 family)
VPGKARWEKAERYFLVPNNLIMMFAFEYVCAYFFTLQISWSALQRLDASRWVDRRLHRPTQPVLAVAVEAVVAVLVVMVAVAVAAAVTVVPAV